MPTPSATISTLQVGTYNSVTDAFTQVLDLNDRVTYFIRPGGATLTQPVKVYARSSNIRAAGERIAAMQYQNRHITVALNLRAGTTNGLIAAARALIAAIERPPYALRLALPSSTQFVHADVVAVKHTIPSDPQQILAGAIVKCEIDFECRPGFRGDRITLQNLVVNPGFEAPSSTGTTVFTDTFATRNAYTASGGSLTQDVTSYSDAVLTDGPLRYYRLDELGGPTLNDASMSGQNATASGSGVSYNQTGLLAGTGDAACVFDGVAGLAQIPTSGLPTGASAWTMEAWVKPSASTETVAIGSFGTNTTKQGVEFGLISGKPYASIASGTQVTWGSALTAGTTHHVVAYNDGTNLGIVVDGGTAVTAAHSGQSITASTASISQWYGSAGGYFAGTIDEFALYAGALSAARITAHYTAGHVAPTSAANTMNVPVGATASFGSSAWGAINTWWVRFRYRAGMTAFFHAHAPDASDNLGVEIGANTLYLQHTVAGVQHILGSASFMTFNEVWYWIQFTQFPSLPGTQCDVQATLFRDSNGALGAQVAALGPVATFDGVTALTGKAQFTTSGQSLGLGGAYTGVHTLSLFGPGGWGGVGNNGSPTGVTSLAWEQNGANTYPGGAVTSFGAARMDLPPAGTVGAFWETYSGGAPAGTQAIPTAAGQVMGASVSVRSTGLSGTASLTAQLREWDASGNPLRATTLQTLTGNQASWTKLSGAVTMGASTAFCSLILLMSDATSGGSANGVVWWDNAQCWNETTTGQTTMPYCELGFAQSPAQLLVTGLLGDLPAPALVSIGTWISSLATGYGAVVALGRRAQASANARMVAAGSGFYGTALSPTATAVLDATSYGGYYPTVTANPSWNPRAFSFPAADLLGVFHLVNRFYTAETSNLSTDVQTRIVTQQKTGAWLGALDSSDQLGAYYGLFTSPIQNGGVWSVVDSGQVTIPALPVGAATDLTQLYLTPRPQWGDSNPGGSVCRANWQCLLPTDAETVILQLINANNAPFGVSNSWLWVYVDGLATQQGGASSATYSLEATPAPNPGHAGGGPGTSATGVLSVNSEAAPFVMLDPLVSCPAVAGAAAGGMGVNQFAGYAAEAPYSVTAADTQVLSWRAELRYSPLYLYPR